MLADFILVVVQAAQAADLRLAPFLLSPLKRIMTEKFACTK